MFGKAVNIIAEIAGKVTPKIKADKFCINDYNSKEILYKGDSRWRIHSV